MSPVSDEINSIKSNWYFWIFPLFAILITGWIFYKNINDQGPLITIFFEDASSLQAERTHVRFRGVSIGIVKKISLTDDNKNVAVSVRLEKDAESFAVEGSKFWVVLPKVNFQGISGLETFFGGPYIAVQPGHGKEDKFEFKGQMDRESNDSVENTVAYDLETTALDSVSEGDPVMFRGLRVGSVTKLTLSKTAQTVIVQINIQHKYVRLVRANTIFWRKVGVQAKLGLFNSEVKINSLESLLRGGIDFFTPEPAGEIAKAQSRFVLNNAPPKGWENWNPNLSLRN